MSHSFVPGPVDVEESVLFAQTKQMLPHRSKEYEAIFSRASTRSQMLFGTQNRVLISTSSGTGFQEAAVRNLAAKSVLCCVNGAFSERWHTVAKMNGRNAARVESDWGTPISPSSVREALKNNQVEAITIVHNETSTGVENPIREIAQVVRATSPDTLICVDAVSSLGGVNFEMDAWGVDFVLTSSQKALALPPGLALAAVSDRALIKAETVQDRGWYFDLVRLEKHRIKNSTPATSAVSLVYALDRQLDRIFDEGLENRFNRHKEMTLMVHGWAFSRGFNLFAQDGFRSQTVSTITNDLGLDFNSLNKFLSERGMRIANGYGYLKGKTFRIAHMGETTTDHVSELLSAIDEYIQKHHV